MRTPQIPPTLTDEDSEQALTRLRRAVWRLAAAMGIQLAEPTRPATVDAEEALQRLERAAARLVELLHRRGHPRPA